MLLMTLRTGRSGLT